MKLLLRDVMESRHMSAAQVAEALNVNPSTVSGWLAGYRKRGGTVTPVFPDFSSLEALCVLFECEPNDLLRVEATTTASGKTYKDFTGPTGRGRPKKATPQEQAAALEYAHEAVQAYTDAVARGDKQADLRGRQRTLTEAWAGAMEAGAEVLPDQVPES